MDDGTQAEWGIGLFTSGAPNTLTRSTVIGNTAGTTVKLNFAGTVRVYNEVPASAVMYFDNSNLPPSSIPYVDGNGILQRVAVWQRTVDTVISAASSYAFPLPTIWARFRVTIESLLMSTNNATLGLQFSSDGGTTYKNSNYSYIMDSLDSTLSRVQAILTASSVIVLTPGLPSVAGGNAWDCVFDIYPGSASVFPRVSGGRGYGVNSVSNFETTMHGGGWSGTAVQMNYAKLLASAGTASFGFRLEGMPP
jgi:hypothetical protein